LNTLNPVYLLLFLSLSTTALSQTWETNKAKLEADGCLSYESDANQNRIPDFSNAGYKGGGVAIPEVPIQVIVSPVPGDNTTNIQDALDVVSSMTPDSNGFRGAVLLKAGTYPVSGQLYIHTSGVVLKGSGDGRDSPNGTIIYGTGNTPAQRDLIIIGGGENTKWEKQIPNTQQNITSNFVQVGSRTFEVADAAPYSVGDNIIIYHPCTIPWLEAIDYGGTASDPGWRENQYPLIFNRFITHIEGNEISIDAPVFNHLDRALSQSYLYTFDRQGLVSNVGIENLRVEIESLGGDDEDHIWDAIKVIEAEDAWVRNATVSGFGLSGVRIDNATRVSIVNVHSIDPVAQITGGRMYNFHISKYANNILIDNCYARAGRHHYVTNGTGSISGIVVLRSRSENPYAASEGHRQWSTGILFDNLIDYGTYPGSEMVMGFYNRGSGGTAHGWGAAHSVCWNASAVRPGKDAEIIVEKPPTAQNYAIGCKGKLGKPGPFDQAPGYIEGSNLAEKLVPASLYEAQLLCRTGTVISDFKASKTVAALQEPINFTQETQGPIASFTWNFGKDASPATASGAGPHTVVYTTEGAKTVSLTVSNGMDTHTETKTALITISETQLFAVDDVETLLENDSVSTYILGNDYYPSIRENYAIALDGLNDKIIYDASRLLDEYPFTMMAWIKTTSDEAQTLMYLGKPASNFTGNSLSMEAGIVSLEAWNYDGSSIKENITATTAINDGNWHHIAGVFESPDSRYLYLDGILAGFDDAEMDNIKENLYRLSVGNREDATPNGWFRGEMDEIRLYAAVLDESDIGMIMNGWDCSENEKVLYWNFNDTSTVMVKDQFNYFDGAIDGASTVSGELTLSPLNATIISGAYHGSARFSDDFEITYVPDTDYTGKDSLTYQLRVGECQISKATIHYQVDEIVGVTNLFKGEPLLYPNPTTGIVQLDLPVPIKRQQLYSRQGELLRELPNQSWQDLSHQPSGLYILKIETKDGKVISKKILKW
jgi:PKD repeat protein